MVVFFLVKAVNKVMKKSDDEEKAAEPSKEDEMIQYLKKISESVDKNNSEK